MALDYITKGTSEDAIKQNSPDSIKAITKMLLNAGEDMERAYCKSTYFPF